MNRHRPSPRYLLNRQINYLRSDPALRKSYDQAVQERAVFLAEELIELADEPIPEGLDPASSSAWIQNKRVRLDTRKWIPPRVYRQVCGDRIDVSVTDGRASVLAALEAADNLVLNIDQDECQ